MNSTNEYIDKKFGLSIINWEISNFCISPWDFEWTIFSPDFFVKAYFLTKWRMSIKRKRISDGECTAIFILKRLDLVRNSEEVLADCKLYICDKTRNHLLEEFEFFFEADADYGITLRNSTLIPVTLCHSTIVRFRLEMLVHFPDITEECSNCRDPGIKKLSEDLLELYGTSEYSDIKFRVDHRFIKGHKGILYHRIRKPSFKERILSDEETIVLGMNDHFGAWDNVFRFLYTANMTHVTLAPKLDIYNKALAFDIQPILSYYSPDQLTLHSTTEVKEFIFQWNIKNFLNRDESMLFSPIMTGDSQEKFKIILYPKSFGNKGKHMGVFFSVEVSTPKDACIEISLVTNGQTICLKRLHKWIVGRENFGYKKLIRRELLKYYLQNGNLIIRCRIRIPTHVQSCSFGDSISERNLCSVHQNYSQLSSDVLALLESSKFSDYSLNVDVDMPLIKLHLCILSVRWRYLLQAVFKDYKELLSTNYSALCKLTKLVYSGKFIEPLDLQDLVIIFEIDRKLPLDGLKSVLASNLCQQFSGISLENFRNEVFSVRDDDLPIR